MARLQKIALSNENGHNGQETRGACSKKEEEEEKEEEKEEKLLQRISNKACFATRKGSAS